MKFYEKTTIEGLKAKNIPTFNICEHFLVKPLPNTMQTIVIELPNQKYMTVNINPESDNVDVKLHGEHKHAFFGKDNQKLDQTTEGVHAFFNMNEEYNNM